MTELKQALQADFYEAMGRSETPKKPPSARMIYVNEQLARRKITADAFSEWKAMTEEDKKVTFCEKKGYSKQRPD